MWKKFSRFFQKKSKNENFSHCKNNDSDFHLYKHLDPSDDDCSGDCEEDDCWECEYDEEELE